MIDIVRLKRLLTEIIRNSSELKRLIEENTLSPGSVPLKGEVTLIDSSRRSRRSGLNGNLTSDVDLLVVWDTPLGFLERTVELYRRLQPRVPLDLLVYTPDEMKRMIHNPLIRRASEEGRVLHEA